MEGSVQNAWLWVMWPSAGGLAPVLWGPQASVRTTVLKVKWVIRWPTLWLFLFTLEEKSRLHWESKPSILWRVERYHLSQESPLPSLALLQHMGCFVEMAYLTSRTPCKTLRSSEKRTCFACFLIPAFLSPGYWIDQWCSVLTDLLGMRGKQWLETERSLLPLSLNLKEIQRGMLNVRSIFWWRVRQGEQTQGRADVRNAK